MKTRHHLSSIFFLILLILFFQNCGFNSATSNQPILESSIHSTSVDADDSANDSSQEPAILPPQLTPVPNPPATPAAGTPFIRSISLQRVLENEVVTVTGANFGSFGGNIISWDDFENQTLNRAIQNSPAKIGGNWTTIYGYDGLGASWDNTNAHSGNIAAHLNWGIDSNSIRAFGWAGKGPFNRLYISYMRFMIGNYNSDNRDNHKQFYLYGNSGQFPQLMPLIPAGSDQWGVYNNVGDGSVPYSLRNNLNKAGWNYSNTINKFQRWEIWASLNDLGKSNGTVKMWVDGVLGVENYTYESRVVNGEWVDFRLGHMAQGFTDTARAWFDDVYIATTQARVEICDSPTWANCRQREIQIVDPAAWASGSLTFRLRHGGQSSLSGKYIYVVNQNGAVNTNGYPL